MGRGHEDKVMGPVRNECKSERLMAKLLEMFVRGKLIDVDVAAASAWAAWAACSAQLHSSSMTLQSANVNKAAT